MWNWRDYTKKYHMKDKAAKFWDLGKLISNKNLSPLCKLWPLRQRKIGHTIVGCKVYFLIVQLNMKGTLSLDPWLSLKDYTLHLITWACPAGAAALPPAQWRCMRVRQFRELTQQKGITCPFSILSCLVWDEMQRERGWDHNCYSLAQTALGTQTGDNRSQPG